MHFDNARARKTRNNSKLEPARDVLEIWISIYKMDIYPIECMTTDTLRLSKNNTHSLCYVSFKTRKIWNKNWSLSGGIRGKESTCQCRRQKTCGFDPWVRKIPWRRKWQSTPVFLPGESHGQRSLTGYSPWGHKSWTWLKRLTMHTHISFFNKSSSCSLIF